MRLRTVAAAVAMVVTLAACGTDGSSVKAKGTSAGEQADADGDRLTETIRSSNAVGVMLAPPAERARG